MIYITLFASISLEVLATSLMKKTEGFTNVPITFIMLGCYALSFYLVSLVVKELPVGVVYATWSGLGMVFISVIGLLFYKQTLDLPGVLGLCFIIIGVVLMNIFSSTSSH